MSPRRALPAIAAAAIGGFLLLVVAPAAVLLLTISALAGGATSCQGPGGPTTSTATGTGVAPNADQAAYAQMITSIVAARGLPQQAAVVAIATAAQESGLGQVGMNTALDHDSLGLFQQRPSAGWGSPAQVKDPTYATNTFLDHLIKVAGWATQPVTVAAQTVQGSAFPSAYAKWETEARNLAAKFWPPTTPTTGNPTAAATPAAGTPAAGNNGAGTPASAAGVQDCPGRGGDGLTPTSTPGGGRGGVTAPTGLPTAPDPQARTAVAFALAQLGKPYQWGATGPDAYDCSGLMLASWRAAGTTLPRVAAAQSRFGTPITDPTQLQPGDLIFIAGAHGTPTAPGHVGMYLGNGQLINAPDENQPVQTTPLTKWQGKITTIRRPGATHPDPPAPAVQA